MKCVQDINGQVSSWAAHYLISALWIRLLGHCGWIYSLQHSFLHRHNTYHIVGVFHGSVIFAFFTAECDLQKISLQIFILLQPYLCSSTDSCVCENMHCCSCCSSYSTKTPRVHSLFQFSLLLLVPSLMQDSLLPFAKFVQLTSASCNKCILPTSVSITVYCTTWQRSLLQAFLVQTSQLTMHLMKFLSATKNLLTN